jgi:hypothetical protein
MMHITLLTGVQEKKEAEPEPDFSMLDNPARVTVQQRRHIAMPDARWAPMRELAGIVIVKDTTPDEAFELVELTAPKGVWTCRPPDAILRLPP